METIKHLFKLTFFSCRFLSVKPLLVVLLGRQLVFNKTEGITITTHWFVAIKYTHLTHISAKVCMYVCMLLNHARTAESYPMKLIYVCSGALATLLKDHNIT